MGFSHYWTPAKNVEDDAWQDFIEVFEKMLDHVNRKMGIDIVNGYGDEDTHAKITDEVVMFNGLGEDSHETFRLNRGGEWDFCKTARKPYDLLVVATIHLGEQFGIIKEWSSDGDEDELREGKYLANQFIYEGEEDPDEVVF